MKGRIKTIIMNTIKPKNPIEYPFKGVNLAAGWILQNGVVSLIQANAQGVGEIAFNNMLYDIATEAVMARLLNDPSDDKVDESTHRYDVVSSSTEPGFDETKRIAKTSVSSFSADVNNNEHNESIDILKEDEKIDTLMVEKFVTELEAVVEQYCQAITSESMIILGKFVDLDKSEATINQATGDITIMTVLQEEEQYIAPCLDQGEDSDEPEYDPEDDDNDNDDTDDDDNGDDDE